MPTQSNTRRALLRAGLALPFLARTALADDAFKQHAEGFSSTSRSPSRWLLEFDPAGRLSNQLVSLYLFDQLGSTIDLARPYVGEKLTLNAGTLTTTASAYGGNAINTNGNGLATNFVGIGNPLVTLGTGWAISFLVEFNGTSSATFTGSLVMVEDAAQTNGIGVVNANNTFTMVKTSPPAAFATPLVSGLNGWHRLTFSTDGSNSFCYLDGKLSSQVVGAGPTNWSPQQFAISWPWPIADVFMWNRTLGAAEIATHYGAPYGTTMRAREEFRHVGAKCGTPTVGGFSQGFSNGFNVAAATPSCRQSPGSLLLMMGVGG